MPIIIPPSTRAVIAAGSPGGTIKSGGNPGPAGPGGELGYSEVVSTWTTTNTTAGSVLAAAKVTGLLVTVVGTGAAVDVEFYAASAYHSVANTALTFYIITNGAVGTSSEQVAGIFSPSTTTGPFVCMRRRQVLASGTSYTFEVGASAAAAGTTTVIAAGFAAIQLSVTGR